MSEGAPPRVLFENLADGSSLELPVNPETIEEALESDDEDITSIGLSHQVVQYKGTKNLTLNIEMYVSDDAILRRGGDETRSLMEIRAWLLSLQYPVADQDLGRVGKPRVLFIWPGLYRVTGRVRGYRGLHHQFDNAVGRPTRSTFVMAFVVESDVRRLMADVQTDGTILGGTR